MAWVPFIITLPRSTDHLSSRLISEKAEATVLLTRDLDSEEESTICRAKTPVCHLGDNFGSCGNATA
ncbi:MAG: hypothetical protein IPJ97_13045 [Proteobacteria bacterium]|nr:hypothetical protein [Pseudomonadota bacterium]